MAHALVQRFLVSIPHAHTHMLTQKPRDDQHLDEKLIIVIGYSNWNLGMFSYPNHMTNPILEKKWFDLYLIIKTKTDLAINRITEAANMLFFGSWKWRYKPDIDAFSCHKYAEPSY